MKRASHPNAAPSHRGFTLVELLVVIAILSMLAATAVMMVRLPLKRARVEANISEIVALDANARLLGRAADAPVLIQINSQHGTVQLLQAASEGMRVVTTINTGAGTRIDRVWVQGRESGSQEVRLQFDRRGASDSYALRLIDSQDRTYWILFLGMSGQVRRVAGEEAEHAIRQILAA